MSIVYIEIVYIEIVYIYIYIYIYIYTISIYTISIYTIDTRHIGKQSHKNYNLNKLCTKFRVTSTNNHA